MILPDDSITLPPPPFIFTPASDAGSHAGMNARSSRESIQRLARVLRWHHQNHASDAETPLLFPAGYELAPELIAACWLAGCPFLVMPPEAESAAGFQQEIRRYVDVLPYDWQGALREYLAARPAGARAAEAFEAQLSDTASWPAAAQDERVFTYMRTSGSSGRPKVIALQRRQFVAAARVAARNIKPPRNSCWLLCLPLHHIGGVSVVLRSWLYGNAVLDLRGAGIGEMAHHIRHNEAVSLSSMVPTQLHQMLELHRDEQNDESAHKHFQAILLGGGPSEPALIEAARARKLPIMKSYGMTETCAQIFATPMHELFTAPPHSSGKLLGSREEGYAAEIRAEGKASKTPLTAGETGLLWLRGPQIIQPSAVLQPKDEKPASPPQNIFDADGWFCTGDYARLDESGHLFIEMRRSDLIVSGGKNINPMQVETAIRHAFSEVQDCAVAGIADAYWGQRPVAFLVMHPEVDSAAFTTKRFVETLRKTLPGYMIPREIRFLPALPRTALGKLKRGELQKGTG